jgi:hypothetical protein
MTTIPPELVIWLHGKIKGGDDHVEGAFGGSSGATGALRGFVPRPPGQRSSRDAWRTIELGLAWSGGYSGPLGQVTVSFGFPLSGFFLAVGAAGLFLLAALTVIGIWVPFGWGYSLFPILVTEYAFIRPSRHSVQCHRTALSHHQHGTKLLTDDMKSVQQAARVRLRGGSDGAIGSPLGFYPF